MMRIALVRIVSKTKIQNTKNSVMNEEWVQNSVMNEELVQNSVMNEGLVQNSVMNEEWVQNGVMNEKFVKNFVMNAKIDPKVVMDPPTFRIGGWNSLQPINQKLRKNLFMRMILGLVTQYLERHSVSSDQQMKKLMPLRQGLHVMMQCYMRQHFADRY